MFILTEEHRMIQSAAREFAEQILKPGVIERDEWQKFPTEEIRQLGEMGFLGMMVDPQYGGAGMDTRAYVLVMEELSKIDASASVVVSVNNSLVCYALEKYGSDYQKEPVQMLLPKPHEQKIMAITIYSTGLKIGLPTEIAEDILSLLPKPILP
jgi:alkylation response protein AidB-like acyl-CoA dehydrogenase